MSLQDGAFEYSLKNGLMSVFRVHTISLIIKYYVDSVIKHLQEMLHLKGIKQTFKYWEF